MIVKHALRRTGPAWAAAFVASVPVLLGYVTLGLAFGLVLVGAGLPWWLSPLMAVFVFAGAAQFMGVGLLASGAGLLEIGVLTLLMNARHAVYGLSLLDAFKHAGRRKPYLVFGLTDETYGLLTTVKPPAGVEPAAFFLALTALDQAYWVTGCTLGAALGLALPFEAAGLEFALTALFVVLLVEQTRAVRRPEPYLAALAAAAFAWLAAGSRDFLLVALLAAIALLLAMRGRLERSGDRHSPGSETTGPGEGAAP